MIYLHPTERAAIALATRVPAGPLTMVNLLRFREWACYDADPGLAPDDPISGAAAYRRYADGIRPMLLASGGAVLHDGPAGDWFIGPPEERWDWLLITRQACVQSFYAFAADPRAQMLQAHRIAALADARLMASPG